MMTRKWMALGFVAALLAAPAVAEESSLDEVLNEYYEAIGGVEAWKGVESARMTGTMKGGQDFEAPFTILFKRPRKSRLEFTFQGMTGIQAYDGETAWFVMPFMGKTVPEPMPAEQAKMIREQSDFDGPLVDFEAKGNKLELIGLEDVEGTGAYRIKVTLDNGDVRHYFLDKEYYLPIRVEARIKMQGTEIDSQTTYGDYKKVGDLVLAHSIASRPKSAPEGSGQKITIESTELNIDLTDDQFAMPAAPPAAADGE